MSFCEDEAAQEREAQLLHSDDDETQRNDVNGANSGYGASGSARRHTSGSSTDPCGYYKVLGVNATATTMEIRRAFLFLSQRYHTDKHTGQAESIQEAMNNRFQELQEAYTVLSDEKQRAAYDAAGAKGAERLALVPSNYTTRQDIIGYVHSLDREADLIRTAKLLSAATDITVSYSTAALFLATQQRQVLSAANGAASPLPRSLTEAGEDGMNAAASASAGRPAGTPARPSTGPNGDGEKATEDKPPSVRPAAAPAASPSAAGQAFSATMTAREVDIDGQRRIVFVPAPEVEEQLRKRIAAASGGAGAAVEGAGAADGRVAAIANRFMQGSAMPGTFRSRAATVLAATAVSAVPTSIVCRHSFQHAISSRLGLVFRTDARSEAGRAQVSVTTAVEFQQDKIHTWAASLRTAIGGLKLTLMRQRVLSPLWTLRSKLTVLNGAQLLQKLETSLTRKLSADTELENTIAWSFNERGFFSSRLTRAWERGTQGLNAYISYHGMTLTAFTAMAVTYGPDTRDPKNPPPRGRVQYTVNCTPFSGQTQVGFEAWYYHAPLAHVGVGFVTVIPYSVSPVAPPLFLVESSQFAVVNQLSLLYARGQHRISLPVIVFVSRNVSQALLWLSVPMFCFRLGSALYAPYAKARAARRYAAQRREHVVEMDIAREKAALEQRAVEQLVMVSRAAEDRKGGLVIINARYGVLSPEFLVEPQEVQPRDSAPNVPDASVAPMASPTTRVAMERDAHAPPLISGLLAHGADALHHSFQSNTSTTSASASASATNAGATEPPREEAPLDIPIFIDVTIALQNLVRDSALVLAGGTKSELVGFCDPDPFTPERKQLKITYWFRKKKHCVILGDEDPVELPQREHLVP